MMPNCKICGHPVVAGPVMHSECLEQMVTEVAEHFCDEYCHWPLTSPSLLEAHCSRCPLDQLMKQAKR